MAIGLLMMLASLGARAVDDMQKKVYSYEKRELAEADKDNIAQTYIDAKGIERDITTDRKRMQLYNSEGDLCLYDIHNNFIMNIDLERSNRNFAYEGMTIVPYEGTKFRNRMSKKYKGIDLFYDVATGKILYKIPYNTRYRTFYGEKEWIHRVGGKWCIDINESKIDMCEFFDFHTHELVYSHDIDKLENAEIDFSDSSSISNYYKGKYHYEIRDTIKKDVIEYIESIRNPPKEKEGW